MPKPCKNQCNKRVNFQTRFFWLFVSIWEGPGLQNVRQNPPHSFSVPGVPKQPDVYFLHLISYVKVLFYSTIRGGGFWPGIPTSVVFLTSWAIILALNFQCFFQVVFLHHLELLWCLKISQKSVQNLL